MAREWQRRQENLTVAGATLTAAELARQLNHAETELEAARVVCASAVAFLDSADAPLLLRLRLWHAVNAWRAVRDGGAT